MIPKYWMITNREVKDDGLGAQKAELTFWTSDDGPLDEFDRWTQVPLASFKKTLVAATGRFPLITDSGDNESQKHLTLFVHGYDNSWQDACNRYALISGKLFDGPEGLGIPVLFSWPSEGMASNYLPDRQHAQESAADFADVLSELYDWLQDQQEAAVKDPKKACRAKTSVIAHSMGNYLLQKAMQSAWTRKNQPLLVSLINQLLMIAADVDNDLFKSGERVDQSDGDAIANLTYRVTALYSGRDAVLGLSAGMKHFGKRRLGRSGLDRTQPIPDNVWDFDCTSLFPADMGSKDVHSGYFKVDDIYKLMRGILRGLDRKVLQSDFHAGGQ